MNIDYWVAIEFIPQINIFNIRYNHNSCCSQRGSVTFSLETNKLITKLMSYSIGYVIVYLLMRHGDAQTHNLPNIKCLHDFHKCYISYES